jgi:hypothetical protein
LSSLYCQFLGGLRWSVEEDALEHQDGSIFAFTEEVALFLEGFDSGGRLISFAFVLHLLYLLRNNDRAFAPGSLRLSHAFADAGKSMRNAGAFCAVLCRDVPQVNNMVVTHDVLDRLRDRIRPIRWFVSIFHDTFDPSEVPPLGPAAFEEMILKQLDAYTTEELRDWLRHGRGPVKEAGKALAQALPPRTLSGALAALLERPRLAGARPFVTQLLSALALPPRRRLQPTIPLGGYADVTTHGQPQLLLPSQFALDEMDFLRRFADRELLYFRREEPHARTRHELVVLLDQGVRTWGDVRLVLGAAVLALGRQAAQARLPFRVAATSGEGEPIDPVAADDATLGELVEASDLSANPGLALERIVERAADGSRDVVLLTHPRNLLEEDVRAAALRATSETRLLALALDGHGSATLSELRHGVPVPIRQFRVDFEVSATLPPIAMAPQGSWHGPVEPVGFPFRFGTTGPLRDSLFDFDYEGDWLFTATTDGLLHAWKTDGSQQVELLPRALIAGQPPGKIEAVIGVMDGLVVVARNHHQWALVHYDLGKRSCAVHVLDRGLPDCHWCYAPEPNVILACRGTSGDVAYVLDLVNSPCYPAGGGVEVSVVLERGRRATGYGLRWLRKLRCLTNPERPPENHAVCALDTRRGELKLLNVPLPWRPFTPLADGLPMLKDCSLLAAQCRGAVLATMVRGPGSGGPLMLRLFRGPGGVPLAEYPVAYADNGFTLSSNGNLLARQIAGWQVEVRVSGGGSVPLVTTYAGGYSSQVQFLLGDSWLLLRTGKQTLHLLNWESGRLHLFCTRDERSMRGRVLSAQDVEVRRFLHAGIRSDEPKWISMPGTDCGLPDFVQYDRQRFILGATNTVTAVLDRFGQVAIFDAQHQLVSMFFVFRGRLSGWLPDGTCFGPASPTGRPATADDLNNFGRALAQASEWGRRTALCE